MIYIQRSRIVAPSKLEERKDEINIEIERIHSNVLEGERIEFGQLYFKAISYCRNGIRELFRHKCAYCETLITNSDVDAFRPKVRAINSNGRTSVGYYWLAFDWNNLYNSCQECNRYKNVRFPVKGPRLEYPSKNFSDENALLLDPCHPFDWNEEHFEFKDNGQIHPKSEKAHITIEVFGLNRENLIQRRLEHIRILRQIFQQGNKAHSNDLKTVLKFILDHLELKNEHLALKRELVNQWLQKKRSKLVKTFPELVEKIEQIIIGESSSIFDLMTIERISQVVQSKVNAQKRNSPLNNK